MCIRDSLLSKANNLAKEIGDLHQRGLADAAIPLKAESQKIKEESKILQERYIDIENKIEDSLFLIPNIPHHSVPIGNSEKDNLVIKESGTIPNLIKGSKPHWQLVDDYNLIDFELGNKAVSYTHLTLPTKRIV